MVGRHLRLGTDIDNKRVFDTHIPQNKVIVHEHFPLHMPHNVSGIIDCHLRRERNVMRIATSHTPYQDHFCSCNGISLDSFPLGRPDRRSAISMLEDDGETVCDEEDGRFAALGRGMETFLL